jgi:branched-chain amino acid transport system substrate-binding protein
MKKVLLPLSVVLLVAMLAGCSTATATQAPAASGMPDGCQTDTKVCAAFKSGETIKIGFAGPMSGGNSSFGIDASEGIDIALKDAGEFEGHTFTQVPQDDEASPEVAATVAQKLVSDPQVVAVVGHLFSGATKAAMPTYHEANVVMASPSATAIELTTLPDAAVFNRIVGNDKFQGELAANFLYTNLGVKKIAVIHDGGAYGQALAERTRDVFTGLGGEVVSFQAITTNETDYSAVLTDVAAHAPEAIFYGGYTNEANVIVRNMATAKMDIPFVSDDGIYGTQFIDLSGDSATGVYCTSAGSPAASDARSSFDTKFMDAYGVAAGSQSPYSWYSYDAATVIVNAIKKVAIVGSDGNLYIPRADLVKAVRATSVYQGITGDVTCDANGECSNAGFSVYQVQDGAWVELTKDFKP